MEQHVELWNRCLSIVKDNVGESMYSTWFTPIVPLNYSDNKLLVQVPSQFFYEYIEEQFAFLLRQALNRVTGHETQLLYRIMIDHSNTNNGSTTLPTADAPVQQNVPTNAPINTPFTSVEKTTFDPQLNRNYNFSNYIEGVSNRLARCAGLNIAEQPGRSIFNPIFIWGASAVGKTHLANAIGLAVKENYPEKRVLYVSANLFQMQYSDAVMRNQSNDFLNFYQSIDVLIIDDVQELAGKTKTQNTFFHIFNHLHQTGKQLIMCCDREPSKLEGMEDRLLSRFKWGLVVEVEKPDFNLRKAILKHKIYKDGIVMPEEVIDYIAENVTSSVRDLEGVLISLLAHSTLMNAEINIQLAQKIVGNVVETPTIEKEDITVDKICNIVCQYYSLPLEAINSKSRERKIAEARQVAMYLARTYTNTSLSVIGQSMGNRDHTTVLYACRTVQNQMDVDSTFKTRIHTLETQIQQK
ncbi:MAG: chromosomal replication initiator protein DnaA [Paludibacteraceae bacterium]|nr:chromosomal replication initiator protein DnaA [Paludibacteraceae bacterium]MBR6520466.1 chromosomal replication initiator protein DnaA [Paludibacteraceae bacterium]